MALVVRHALFAESLTAVLEDQGALVVGNGRTGDEGALPHRPDVRIVEEWLPDTLAPEVTANVPKGAREATPKLVLVTNRTGSAVDEAMDSGAVDAVVPVRCRLEQLVETLSRVMDGRRIVARPPASAPGAQLPLSEREREVLDLLATGATNAQIGEKLGISVNTVRSHVQNVLQKFGVHQRIDAVHVAAESAGGTSPVAAE